MTKPKTSIFERNPKKTIFFTVLIVSIVIDVFATNIYYAIQKIQNDRNKVGLGIKHPVYHHTFKENAYSEEHELRVGNYPLYTNSLGFKDKSNRKISKSTENRRILFIGDSFTEGSMLEYQDTFVGIIDEKLSKKQIEVLNAGRVSYSPIIYWRKIKYLLEDINLKFDELVVFVDISDVNDEAVVYRLNDDLTVGDTTAILPVKDYSMDGLISNERIEQIRLFFRNNSTIYSNGLNWIHDLFFPEKETIIQEKPLPSKQDIKVPSKTSIDQIVTTYRSNWTTDKNLYAEWGEDGVNKMIFYMNKLLAIVNDNDIELTVAIYPWPSQIWYEDLNSIHVKIWENWCNENNVGFINYFPEFVIEGISNEEKNVLIDNYFLPFDVHYNKTANKLIADKFLKEYHFIDN